MRTVLALYRSQDLKEWTFLQDVINYSQEDPKQVGFQYPYFLLDGKEMLVLVRSALNCAHSYHDANCTLFKRISIGE